MNEIDEENIEVETVETQRYIWTCPRCGKKIEGPTEKKVKVNASQHKVVKHGGGG